MTHKATKKFAVFDIDGTLIRWQLYHAIADQLIKSDHFDKKLFAPVHEARMVWKKRDHELSFKQYERLLVQTFDKAILDVSHDDFMRAVKSTFNEYKQQTYTYTRDLIAQLKNRGYLIFALSGSQTEIIELLAGYYGFDDFGGSSWEYNNGKFTGKKEVMTKAEKPKLLKSLMNKHGATFDGSIALGDSESDIELLSMVENPIAFNPDKGLFEHAKSNGWQVIVERKNMIYELKASDGSYLLV